VAAWESRDATLITAVLSENVTFAMPPFPHWWSGRGNVIDFIVSTGRQPLRHLLTPAGGQPAIGWYMRRSAGLYLPTSIEVLALDGERIRAITAFATPALFPQFGLPLSL
jgi:RNA polymerase sigma-70 factor, ECF subfamily